MYGVFQRPFVFIDLKDEFAEYDRIVIEVWHVHSPSPPEAVTAIHHFISFHWWLQLFNDIAPLTVENFRCLCTGERGEKLHYKVSLGHHWEQPLPLVVMLPLQMWLWLDSQ